MQKSKTKTMAKKMIPGLLTAIINGIPLGVDLIKKFKKKKVHSIDELQTKPVEELIGIVKGHEEKDNESWIMFLVKSAVTLATVWFILWSTKQFGISRQDILDLFGLIK